MTKVPPISGAEKYVDSDGRLTWEGQKLLGAVADILEAIGGVGQPAGGATVDVEARTAISAIIVAAS